MLQNESIVEQLDLAYSLEPSTGLHDKFIDAWRTATDMSCADMRDNASYFSDLNMIACSAEQSLQRRGVASRILREIFMISNEAQQKTILETAHRMSETSALARAAHGIIALKQVYK